MDLSVLSISFDDPYGEGLDEDVSLISMFPNLESIELEHVEHPPNRYLACLRTCSKLKELKIAGRALTNDDIACVGDLRQLRCLSLSETGFFPGANVRPLCQLDQLDKLILTDAKLTDGEATQLCDLPNLRCLYIGFNDKITSRCIAQLLDPSVSRFAPRLEQIFFDIGKADDGVVAALKQLPRLHYIAVTYGSRVGDVAVLARLRQALPDRDLCPY